MKMAVFRVVAPCSLVEVYWPFRSACSLHHQGDAASISETSVNFYQPWRWTQNASPKRWLLPISRHGDLV
jgi:hypothetical protein